MTKQQIVTFLSQRLGYLKNSPIDVAKAIWKKSDKHTLPKTKAELKKELELIATVQSDLRKAKTIEDDILGDNLLSIYDKIIEEKNKPKKIMYYDCETSPNLVFSWNVGRKINIDYDNIVQERGIICICWKFKDDPKVYSLSWKDGNDKEMLQKFAKVAESCDILIGHNSDNFDIKHIRARCIYHNIPIAAKFQQIDTLKMARQGFKFNCAKLNYLGQYLGVGKKIDTNFGLWKSIVLNNDKKALAEMIRYCCQDVLLLQAVHEKLEPFSPVKKMKFKI